MGVAGQGAPLSRRERGFTPPRPGLARRAAGVRPQPADRLAVVARSAALGTAAARPAAMRPRFGALSRRVGPVLGRSRSVAARPLTSRRPLPRSALPGRALLGRTLLGRTLLGRTETEPDAPEPDPAGTSPRAPRLAAPDPAEAAAPRAPQSTGRPKSRRPRSRAAAGATGTLSRVSFSMSRRNARSSALQNEIATPAAPARAVRPMRWT